MFRGPGWSILGELHRAVPRDQAIRRPGRGEAGWPHMTEVGVKQRAQNGVRAVSKRREFPTEPRHKVHGVDSGIANGDCGDGEGHPSEKR